MSWPRVFSARVRGLVFRGQLDRQLDDELRFHLEMQAEDNLRNGMDPEEARYDAMRRFGGMLAVKEEYRENRTFAAVEAFFRDIRYTLRTLGRNPGFTAVAVMTLAIGIGVNAAVFTVTNATLFKGFPQVDRNDRLLYMTSGRGCCVSWADFQDWRAQAKSFQGMALVHGVSVNFSDRSGFPERYDATLVTANTFKLAGQKPILGRDFTPADEVPGAGPVAILCYAFWEKQFGKDASIVGRMVRIDGVPTTVIGVMQRGFSFPQNQELWVPLRPTPEVQRRDNRDTWFVFGRLSEGVTVKSARAEMEAIGRRLGNAYPLTNQGRNLVPYVENFREFFIGSNATVIYEAMWGAVGFVLLIACANLANLLLSRAMSRSREISLRIALGAGRWRIIRQLLIESVMLSGLGGVIGWWIAKWGVYTLAPDGSGVSDETPGTWFDHVLDYSMDHRVFFYLVAISAGTGLLFGLAPALRLSKLNVNAALKDGGRGSTGGGSRGKHLSAILVTAEIALAVVLLAGAGVMIRSFLSIYTANMGFGTENILTALISVPNARYPRTEAQIAFYDRLKTRLEAIPGVESTALANQLPGWFAPIAPFEVDGTDADEQRRPTATSLVIGPGWFRTLGTSVSFGREFADTDGASGIPAAIVNQKFANQQWPGENPLGKRVRLFRGKTPDPWRTVVGVTPNIPQNVANRQELDPVVYVPYRQEPGGGMWVIARTRVPPGSLANAFRREVQALDPELAISTGPIPLAERVAPSLQYRGFIAALFLIFAAIALLLASIGLYAVIAHSVNRRTQEMGTRLALGATAGDILGLVFRQGMIPVGIGLTIGLVAAFAVNPILKSQLVQVSAADPLTLFVASATLILAAGLGCWIPARRAMRVDPVVALRHE
jgi:putative ABC transport system permease protein